MLLKERFLKICVIISIIACVFAVQIGRASALTVSSLYADLNNGTQFSNLLNYATRYDSFYNSAYIGFRDSQNSYYLAWGDRDEVIVEGNLVSFGHCEYVRYYRQNNTSDWQYVYAKDDTLSLSCDRLVTTNIPTVLGFSSIEYDEFEYRQSIRRLGIVLGSMFVALGLFLAVRR